MLRKWSMFVLMLLVAPTLVFAQNTGKIAGVVTDADTGDPLPGASVLLVGTTMGTITDVDGNYFVIGVPVGAYDVQASFVGYQTSTVAGVEVSSGYTRELNFSLGAGVELDEIIVEYERPLIQKDAVGAPKIVTAEEIVNLPVRGAAAVAKIQAGVVSQEGSGTLNVRGGRGSEVQYFIDGVKVFGTVTVPQSAIQEQEMLIGNISARFGDAMSGVISITTKSGASKFFGSVEGISSESLDDFGYNLASLTLGGPISGDKLGFFLSAEFSDQTDSNPRAVGEIGLSDSPLFTLDQLNAAPTGFAATDADGNPVYLPIPASLADGATMTVDDSGNPVVTDGALSFSDGTTVAMPDGATLDGLRPVVLAELLGTDDFVVNDKKLGREYTNLSLAGNINYSVLENARLRVGGRLNTGDWDALGSTRHVPFALNMLRQTERDDWQAFATWTHHLSNSTFYQLQVDMSDRQTETYDPRFGTSDNDFLEYSNLDNDAFATLRGYKNLSMVDDGTGLLVPTYTNVYKDGAGPATSDEVVSTLVQIPGGRFNGYGKAHNTQFRLSASATTQIGLHQIEFGGEYEKRTQRNWSIGSGLSRYVNDGNAEAIAPNDPDLLAEGYSTFADIPDFIIDSFVTNQGYDLRGHNEVDTEDFDAFVSTDKAKPTSAYNRKPYEPIYYGAYVQDKIEFRDIVLNLGLRVDVFDNNQRVFKDRFSRRPVVRAGDLGTTLPAGIGNDYAVFFSGDDVVGYRDNNGEFFTAAGQSTSAGSVLLQGNVRQTSGVITQDMFTDYDPQVTLMPRIGVSFPVTDRALFFANYGVVSQRPSSNNNAGLNTLQNTGGINNNNLKPEKTTSYELGFRQRVGARAAFTVSGFFRQIENLIQLREVRGATPSVYNSYENVDFGTVKGVEFGFDLRRTNAISANVNYTLSFADGTGSGSRTTGTIVWVDETPPNFISPLGFDQRHKINVSLDYRLGEGEGPTIGGGKLLQNTGLNILFTAGSGFPYTGVVEPFNLAGAARAANPSGAINGDRMPGQSRIDLRLDRRFPLGNRSSLSVFLWVQNLLDQTNTNNVWRFTGLPDDDGFLATSAGARFLNDKPASAEALYHHRNRVTGWVGIPRMTRIGVRVDF